ncbi:MAG TPA: hypothetical protein VFR81_26725 [Longimicrobium sp.]|nr:hypothetical protein [Longimicrobium sp.]
MNYDPQEISGGIGGFPYAEIPARIPEDVLRGHAKGLRKRCERLAKRWDAERNAEWMVRSYLALKRMISASVLLSSARATRKGKRKPPTSDQVFDGLLDAARACILLLPDQPWNRGALARSPHERVFQLARDSVREIDRFQGAWVARALDGAMDYRRTTLLRAGAEAPAGPQTPRLRSDPATPAARFLCELTQWRSEVLWRVLDERLEPPIGWDFAVLGAAASPTSAGEALLDEDDTRRIGGLMGAVSYPEDVWTLMRHRLDDAPAGLVPPVKGDDVEMDGWLVFPLR